MAVITISRLFGIGGRQFGQTLAGALGYEYFDKELLTLISNKLGATEETVDLYEGMKYGTSKALLELLTKKYPGTKKDYLDSPSYIDAVRSVILELADRDRVVIVGRGGQCILKDHPEAFHLRLIAQPEDLCRALVEKGRFRECRDKELLKKIGHYSEVRRKFIRQHFDQDWEDPLNYHLVINLSRISCPEAVDLAASLITRKGSGEAPEKSC